MTIEDPTVVDFIGRDRENNRTILTISDHLDWRDGFDAHARCLESKIRSYVAHIRSGDVFESYPDSIGTSFEIRLVLYHPPNQRGGALLDLIHERLLELDVFFSYKTDLSREEPKPGETY